MDDMEVQERFDAFCIKYDIPEKHHGSLRMLAGMAAVLGFEIEMQLHLREKEEKSDAN